MHDVLSDVLDTLELESSIYFRAELSSPFSISVPENPNVVRFHIASEGRCTITTEGAGSLDFEPGDMVMVPHGLAHVLSDQSKPDSARLEDVVDASGFDGEGPLVYGGGGERTTLVCGHFGFSANVTHPFIETLPPVLHLRKQEGPNYAWVEQMLAFTEDEARNQPKGWQGVVERLSQILLVYVLRAYMEQEKGTAGALSALTDPQLAAAVQSIHTSPATDWTLDTLAEKARMSRSSFVRKFNCDLWCCTDAVPDDLANESRSVSARADEVFYGRSGCTGWLRVGSFFQPSLQRPFRSAAGDLSKTDSRGD